MRYLVPGIVAAIVVIVINTIRGRQISMWQAVWIALVVGMIVSKLMP